MRAVLHELRNLDTRPAALRRFGQTVGAAFVLIAGALAWRGGWQMGPGAWAAAGLGVALVGFGLLAPRALRRIYVGWMAMAFALGFVMTNVLLTVVFFGLVTPTGLVRRLMGHDPMRRRPAPTYWIPRTDAPAPDAMRRMG